VEEGIEDLKILEVQSYSFMVVYIFTH